MNPASGPGQAVDANYTKAIERQVREKQSQSHGDPRYPRTIMPSPHEDQETLLTAACSGDDDALGDLIENFRPMLRADAMQSLRPVQGRIDAFIGWLRTIHERTLRDIVRDQNAEKRNIHREVSPSAFLPRTPARVSTPSQKLVTIEEQQHMEACLEKLPAAQKQALRLR